MDTNEDIESYVQAGKRKRSENETSHDSDVGLKKPRAEETADGNDGSPPEKQQEGSLFVGEVLKVAAMATGLPQSKSSEAHKLSIEKHADPVEPTIVNASPSGQLAGTRDLSSGSDPPVAAEAATASPKVKHDKLKSSDATAVAQILKILTSSSARSVCRNPADGPSSANHDSGRPAGVVPQAEVTAVGQPGSASLDAREQTTEVSAEVKPLPPSSTVCEIPATNNSEPPSKPQAVRDCPVKEESANPSAAQPIAIGDSPAEKEVGNPPAKPVTVRDFPARKNTMMEPSTKAVTVRDVPITTDSTPATTTTGAVRDFPVGRNASGPSAKAGAVRDFPVRKSTTVEHPTRPKTIRDFPVRRDPTSPPKIVLSESSALHGASATPSAEPRSLILPLENDSSRGAEKDTNSKKPPGWVEKAPQSQDQEMPEEPSGKEIVVAEVTEKPEKPKQSKVKEKAGAFQAVKPKLKPKAKAKSSRGDRSRPKKVCEEVAGVAPAQVVDCGKELTEEARAEALENVRQALREYNAVRRHLLQESEACTSKEGKVLRPDLKAGTIMRDKGKTVNCVDASGKKAQIIGEVPGVLVGMQFYFRQEMVVIGLHVQIQAGIDWVTAAHSPYKKEIATAVIASGGYEDDLDQGEMFDYTGQGGNNYRGDKKQSCDQEMVRGNLGLKNSCELGVPVRVVRGSPEKNSETGMVYTYDGLYKVESWKETRGESGHRVYKFHLVRMPGQPPLSSSQVEFVRTSLKSDLKIKDRKGVVLEDIAQGDEKVAICCVNTIDDPPVPPPEFKYTREVVYSPSIDVSDIKPQVGCNCKGGCTDAMKCACARMNQGTFPYTRSGLLVELQTAVYECGPNCACACQKPACHNRVAQIGLRYRFEIFKTASKGWAVRSWDAIPAGAFICEYTGMLYTDEEAEDLKGRDEYLYNLDLVKGNKDRWGNVSELLGHGRASFDVSELEESKFCVDGKEVGNLARFINHSCQPNLVMQCVFYDHHDMRLPHLMLFAAETIPPLKELTYDYNYTIGSVLDADGNLKSLACHCGARNCRGRLY